MYTTIQKFVISKCFNVFERSLYFFDQKDSKHCKYCETFLQFKISVFSLNIF